jgi:hypothetical protein
VKARPKQEVTEGTEYGLSPGHANAALSLSPGPSIEPTVEASAGKTGLLTPIGRPNFTALGDLHGANADNWRKLLLLRCLRPKRSVEPISLFGSFTNRALGCTSIARLSTAVTFCRSTYSSAAAGLVRGQKESPNWSDHFRGPLCDVSSFVLPIPDARCRRDRMKLLSSRVVSHRNAPSVRQVLRLARPKRRAGLPGLERA